jgi:hypothetical protein
LRVAVSRKIASLFIGGRAAVYHHSLSEADEAQIRADRIWAFNGLYTVVLVIGVEGAIESFAICELQIEMLQMVGKKKPSQSLFQDLDRNLKNRFLRAVRRTRLVHYLSPYVSGEPSVHPPGVREPFANIEQSKTAQTILRHPKSPRPGLSPVPGV